jgi:hypothetical protein
MERCLKLKLDSATRCLLLHQHRHSRYTEPSLGSATSNVLSARMVAPAFVENRCWTTYHRMKARDPTICSMHFITERHSVITIG